jgi:nucleotide-binding universal stress UspA family protein
MRAFRKILVPTDFSENAGQALETAVDLANRYEAALHLLHVDQLPTYAFPEGVVVAGPDMLASMTDWSDKGLAAAKAQAERLGAVRVTVQAVIGTPFTDIIRVAREEKADLIVMGTHGRTGLAHALLGSVAEKVVRKAPCPVLTVRPLHHKFVHP